LLLAALDRRGSLRRFVPFDVSEPTLRMAAVAIEREFEGIDVHAVVGDFERHLPQLPRGGRRVVAFLGGTIGNLPPAPRARFLRALARGLSPGEWVLLGTDLVKEPARLEAAYDDAAGVTAAFNRNVLTVLNRELGAGFVPERFTHVARWDAEREWVEMRLRADDAQTVPVPGLGLDAHFERDEEMRTEISAKFRRAGVEAEMAGAGLTLLHWWTDPDADFAVALARA
jgi:L-histidine N-alpha-methyltransferase